MCLYFWAGQRNLPQNNLLWLSCVWVSRLWPLDQNAAVTVADQNYHTRNGLSSICLFSVLLHLTATHNVCHPQTEAFTLFPHQRYWCWKRANILNHLSWSFLHLQQSVKAKLSAQADASELNPNPHCRTEGECTLSINVLERMLKTGGSSSG